MFVKVKLKNQRRGTEAEREIQSRIKRKYETNTKTTGVSALECNFTLSMVGKKFCNTLTMASGR